MSQCGCKRDDIWAKYCTLDLNYFAGVDLPIKQRGIGKMGTSELFAVTIICLLVWQFLKLRWASRQLPPGPTPLPVIGSLWCLGLTLKQETLTKVSKNYGKIFTLWMGHIPIIILNGFHTVKEALVTNSEELDGKPITPFILAALKGKGLLFTTGHLWKQQRRFCIMTLRTLSLRNRILEHQIQQEAAHLVDFLATKKGKPVNPSFAIFHSAANVISSMVFGHRFCDDEKFHKIHFALRFLSYFLSSPFRIACDIFPGLMHYLPGPHKKALSCLNLLRTFITEEIKNHEMSRDPADPQDFIDYYLEQIENSNNDTNSTFDEDNLVHNIMDLLGAGSETISTTLLWALVYMVAYPDIQEKVQKELQDVLIPSHKIYYEDRKRLPYTNAVIHEVQRFSNVLLIGSFRKCINDITLQGFHIKKGTIIIPDVASVLYDPEQWETPHQFNPNHFLDKDGGFFCKEAFMPFAAGHRKCLGEHLAKTELFIFFASLLQTFKFQLPEGKKVSTESAVGGTTISPHPYEICFIPY